MKSNLKENVHDYGKLLRDASVVTLFCDNYIQKECQKNCLEQLIESVLSITMLTGNKAHMGISKQ